MENIMSDTPSHTLMRPKAPKKARNRRRIVNEGHLKMIRQLPCILSGREAEAAHISYGDLDHEKPHNAMGIKADDCYVIPLCPELHRLANGSQHDCGEREWWWQFGIDPIEVAARLWNCGRNHNAMIDVVNSVQLSSDARSRVLAILKGNR